MTHYTDATNYSELFALGASEVVTDGKNRVALWTQNTPKYNGGTIATIGGCELEDSQDSIKLLSYASQYLSEKFTMVIGPMNGNTWLDYRLITYSDGSPLFALEPNTPPHWEKLFKLAGFETLSEYSSSSIELVKSSSSITRLQNKLNQKGIKIRPMNSEQFQQDLSSIYDLSVECFQKNFLYTDLPKESYMAKYQQVEAMLDPELILIAEKDGQPTGFVFCYPDQSNPQTLIVKTLASCPKKGFLGVGNLLVEAVHNIALEKGFTQAIHALQYMENSSLRITSRYNPKVMRKYELLVKRF